MPIIKPYDRSRRAVCKIPKMKFCPIRKLSIDNL